MVYFKCRNVLYFFKILHFPRPGCYVFAGCSNGMVLLFDMTSNYQYGVIVGHIRAKGLHTNLLLAVKVSEDCRFCFAGVQKGTSELLAIDLANLPVNWESASTGSSFKKKTSNSQCVVSADMVVTHSHSDPKLRGFGSAVRLRNNNTSDSMSASSPVRYFSPLISFLSFLT